jgi:hypothetical protein
MLSGDLLRGGSFGGSFDDAAMLAVLSQDPRVRDLLNKVGGCCCVAPAGGGVGGRMGA